MADITIKINGISVVAPVGSTILEAARLAHIDIPTLCFLKEINEIGACRICVVEVKGARNLVASCVYPINEGMEVFTHTKKVLDSRRKTLELILSNHDRHCLSCKRNGTCELQKLCKDLNVEDECLYEGERTEFDIDTSALHMYRDNNKCILCRRCSSVCSATQSVGVIGANNRGFQTNISCAFEMDLASTACVNCGQCIAVCPTGALCEKDHADDVLQALRDPDKYVIVQTAPAVRATLGEEFGLPIGTNVTGKMVSSLRLLGFDKVFDTDFAADLTILEEANEFLTRLTTGGTLPMITSCCPGWIKYLEHYFPDMIEHLSTCKSPQQMFGAITKSYYADKIGVDPKKIVMVSVMPCTAKKYELQRPDQEFLGILDVDLSITVRELGNLIKRAGIDFISLPDNDFDHPLGLSTGASVIFGTTGGVMEAALRTAVYKLTNENNDSPIEFREVRGLDGIKEATFSINGEDISIAVVSSLSNAKKLLQKVQNGEVNYHFIEVMACPGGCINGGGLPHVPASIRNYSDYISSRAHVLYTEDENKSKRRSHENEAVLALYEEYLEAPNSHKAHELLHTSYVKRSVNSKES